jgi:transketolase
VAKRYEAYGWHVLHVEDANDTEAIAAAYQAAIDEPERPSFIRLRTHIAWGAPNAQDTSKAHGAALGEDEVRATKEVYGWNPDKHFKVPEGVPERWQVRVPDNQQAHADWRRRLADYADVEPELAAELQAAMARELPAGWDAGLEGLFAEPKKQATRKASQQAINAIAPNLPTLVGGSADLAESNLTDIAGGGDLTATEAGRNLRFGVREHGMGAISNGLAAHGGLRPFCATFLVFSDYMRGSARLAALMGLPVIFVWTHDSIGLGGDGPTHQPIEHLNSLRLLPNLWVIRPADGPETAEAWRAAVRRTDGPTALVLSRQELPVIDRHRYAPAAGLHRGAYMLAEASGGEPELILLATGSEVWLALAARDELEQRQEIPTRVVSMPCWELFEAQPQDYRDQVLPPQVTARLAVEAGSTALWHKWVGTLGGVVGIDQFGASAAGGTALIKFGFTEDNVVERALAVLHREHVEKARMLRNLSA